MSDTKTPAAADSLPTVPPDPIYQKSYSVHIAVASVALVASVAYAIAQEAWLLRPYKPIQAEWKASTLVYLDRLEKERLDFRQAIELLEDYTKLRDEALAVDAATKAERDKLAEEFDDLDREVNALKEAIKVHRSAISALTYDAEHAAHEAFDAGETAESDPLKSAAAAAAVGDIQKVRAETVEFEWARKNGEKVKVSEKAGVLIDRFTHLQEAKGLKQQEVGRAFAAKSAADKKRDEWVGTNLKSIKAFLAAAPEDLVAKVAAKVTEVGIARYLDDYVVTAPPETVAKLRTELERFPTDPLLGGEIQKFQIHVKDTANWVDRCEVCHLGARSVIPVTADALKSAIEALPKDQKDAEWPASRIEATKFSLYASHPRAAELFGKHDPDKMGCSTCHNGNGIAIVSTELAHGQNHHWDWPLFAKENLEAGCLQCHQADAKLAGGPRISEARDTFMDKGCWGCHKYEGYDRELDEITKLDGRIKDLERQRVAKTTRKEQLFDLVGPLEEEATNRLQPAADAERNALQEQISQIATDVDAAQQRLAEVHAERVRVGPNLKDVKVKWRREALTPWVQDPHLVKRDPKMPTFRWFGGADANGLDQEAKDVATYLWQNALDPKDFPEYRKLADAPKGGSAGRGKELFEKRGCMGACHAVAGADGKSVGATFASNLTAVGDKLTYEYAYRWIKAPRHRIVKWSVRLERDLTEEEAKKEDPRTLVERQPTPMPDLRLADDEARDIATYLTSLRSGTTFPDAPWLDDTAKDANGKTAAERGKAIVVYSGCAGCHEIKGLEKERGIGTELTKEGSKPLDRLDYGHLTTAAKRGHEPLADWTTTDGVKLFEAKEQDDGGHHGWYRPRGFFMHKLAKPDLFDTSKYFADRFLRARMPQFDLTAQQIHDLTTFLLGSVETRIPAGSRYQPDEAGQAIRDGWWVIKRYNCEGCHPVEAGQVPALRTLPWFNADTKPDATFPPTLVGAGFRIRPQWMAKFLHDPSMGGGTARPTALRRHLEARMPTFHFTESEVAKLVRFFEAMSNQPFVYQPPVVGTLSEKELKLAEAIWAPTAMNCMQCHLGEGKDGKLVPDAETKAPHFGYAKARLKPEWMRRWIPAPKQMQPWSAMNDDFKRENPDDPHSRWLYGVRALPEAEGVEADHVDVMIRYLFTLPDAK